jgi:hypothetical protein
VDAEIVASADCTFDADDDVDAVAADVVCKSAWSNT